MLLWIVTVVMYFTGNPMHMPKVFWAAFATTMVGLGTKALDNQDRRQPELETQPEQPHL